MIVELEYILLYSRNLKRNK